VSLGSGFQRAALLALMLPWAARAQETSATSCTCSGFYDATGALVQEAPLTKALLVDGTRISSGFGLRIHPIFGVLEFHWGVDVAAPYGTPIHAAADGVIEEAGPNGGYGNYILVRHTGAYATGYGHASSFASGIYPGARVVRGQVIAYIGSTGLSTGPHLHYEIFVKGWRVNPACGCFRPPPRQRRLTPATKQNPTGEVSLTKQPARNASPKTKATQKENL
jgi:murein DD-endopeptidase MepM/ murein hydrolase activator NlpD